MKRLAADVLVRGGCRETELDVKPNEPWMNVNAWIMLAALSEHNSKHQK